MKNPNRILILPLLFLMILTNPEIQAQTQNKESYSDPEIAAIAVTANKIDISYAEIARGKSDSDAVLNFANTMINDHQAVIDKAVNLVNELDVQPEPNALSKKLAEKAKKTRAKLRSKEGSDFDEAYIDNEIAYHKSVIDVVENVLIPNTSNQQLKELLKGVVPALETHLEHALSVKSNMSY